MPASILTTLVVWSAFLLPGAKVVPAPEFASSLALRHSNATISAQLPLIHARPLAGSIDWVISEANSEEEETSDNDDHVIVAARCWTLLRLGLIDLRASIRLDRGFSTASIRTTILRC